MLIGFYVIDHVITNRTELLHNLFYTSFVRCKKVKIFIFVSELYSNSISIV